MDLREFLRPRSLDELWAAFAAAEPPVLVCAGCTDLVPKTRAGALPPGATWIDLRRIPELRVHEVRGDEVTLGACLTHHEVASDAMIGTELPALAAACASVGSRQIRALGTLGGNAANCSPCADSFLALAALDAEVTLRSSGGSRRLPVTAFAKGPGQTVLAAGEVIEAFLVPRRAGRRSVFLKLGPRKAVAVAKVSVAASAVVGDDGELHDVRLALGSVAPTVIRIAEAEAALEGHRRPDDATLATVARAVERAVKPIDDPRSTAAYRRTTSGVLARRALRALVG
jgi:CO/xanthine dehydrogenase FAD-binding subunit